MEIHGKELYQTEDGDGIYYDNILITDRRNGLNAYYSFEDWIRIITNNPDFNPRIYHPNLFGIKTNP